MEKTKVCTRCGIEYPATSEYFYLDKRRKNGLRAKCKLCHSKEGKKYYLGNKEWFNEFCKNHYEENKEEYLKRQSIYRIKNKDKISKYHKEYHAKNRDEMLIKSKEKYKKRIEYYKEKHRQYSKIFHKTERGKQISNINCQKRHARKKELDATFTIEEWNECKRYFNNKCCYCGNESKLQQDHFIALSKDGEYTINNIVPACQSCNNSKNDGNFFKWYPRQGFYNKKREQKILRYLNYDAKTKKQQLALSI
jgi:5-methylcytosine-specific restriction endonuclease McrA